jgi:hypothetical protein
MLPDLGGDWNGSSREENTSHWIPPAPEKRARDLLQVKLSPLLLPSNLASSEPRLLSPPVDGKHPVSKCGSKVGPAAYAILSRHWRSIPPALEERTRLLLHISKCMNRLNAGTANNSTPMLVCWAFLQLQAKSKYNS